MKNLRLFFIQLIFIGLNSYAQDVPYTLYTPRESQVQDTYDTQEMTAYEIAYYNDYVADHYPDAIQIEPSTREYNCHGLAWSVVEGGPQVWIGYGQQGVEEIFWTDSSYDQVTENVCTKISYSGDHSAVPSGTANYYVSKWNKYPLLYHHKDYHPGYGDPNQYFRRSVDVPEDLSSINTAVSMAGSGQTVYVSAGNYSLTGNITIPTGVTLTLGPSANVSFNGYFINPSSGTFNIQNGSTIFLNMGSYYYGLFTSINSAVSASATGQTVYVSAGNYTLTGNIILPSGVTLTIGTGANVDFNGYYINPGSGNINIQNGSTVYLKNGGTYYGLHNSIQAAINASSTWQSVVLANSHYSEYLTFTSKSNITLSASGVTLDGGISVINSSNINISGINMWNGPSINNSTGTYFSSSTVSGSTIASDYYGTYTQLGFIIAENIGASMGLYSTNGTGDLFGSNVFNGDCAAYLTNNASYNIGTGNTFCGNGYDIYVTTGAYAYAISNDYSRALPSSIYGNVFVTGINGVCDMRKTLADKNENDNTKIFPELQAIDEKYLFMLRKMNKDKEENKYDMRNYVDEHDQLVKEYKSLIKEGKDKDLIVAALSKISHLFKGKNSKQELYLYINEILTDDSLKTLEPYFERYLIWKDVDENQYEDALKIIERIYQTSGITEDLQAEMLYEKGLIYKYYLEDISKAEASFNEILKKFPNNILVNFANNELGNGNDSRKDIETDDRTNSLDDLVFECSNYPNPGNPTTTINYTLPHNSDVEISIYDIMGREIRTFIMNSQNVGQKSIVWDSKNNDGESVSSGVYIYRVKLKSLEEYGRVFEKAKKLMLLK